MPRRKHSVLSRIQTLQAKRHEGSITDATNDCVPIECHQKVKGELCSSNGTGLFVPHTLTGINDDFHVSLSSDHLLAVDGPVDEVCVLSGIHSDTAQNIPSESFQSKSELCDSAFSFNPLDVHGQVTLCSLLDVTDENHVPYEVQYPVAYDGVNSRLSNRFLTRKIPSDGNCYFRCLSYCLSGDDDLYHRDLRHRLASYEYAHTVFLQQFFSSQKAMHYHITHLKRLAVYATEADVIATASMLNMCIYVCQLVGKQWKWHEYTPSCLCPVDSEPVGSIYLHNKNCDHFEVVTCVCNPSRPLLSIQHEQTSDDKIRSYAESNKKTPSRLYEEKLRKRRRRQLETTEKPQSRVTGERIRQQKYMTLGDAEKRQSRLTGDRIRQRKSRALETAEKRRSRLTSDQIRQRKSRTLETAEKRQSRVTGERIRQQKNRTLEDAEKRQSRLTSDQIRQRKTRTLETAEKRQSRVTGERIRQQKNRPLEDAEKRQFRLSRDQVRHKENRLSETLCMYKERLFSDRTAKANKLKKETLLEAQHRKAKRKRTYRKKIDRRQCSDITRKLETIRNDIETNAHFAYRCVSDCRYHCFGNVSKLDLSSRSKLENSKTKALADNCMLLDENKSFDGKFYICHYCRRTILAGRIPPCNEKTFAFQVPELPAEFKTDDLALNRCEAHLLKLVIPFIRVAHIPRSSEFKVIGPMICVQANVSKTIDTVLPVQQELIPVALKRRPQYKGSFVEEVVSKNKLLTYFKFFKHKNPLFDGIDFSEEKLHVFMSAAIREVDIQDQWKTSHADINAAEEELKIRHDNLCDDDENDDVAVDDDDNDDASDVRQSAGDESVLLHNESNRRFAADETVDVAPNTTSQSLQDDEDYDLPGHITELSSDTLIDPFFQLSQQGQDHVTELLANAVIEQEEFSNSTNRSNRMPFINIAPTAEGSFQYWETAEHLEEKCFPHLFPTGTGGYISTYQKQGIGFANYVKQRILGFDPRFRDDPTYLFFLYMVKEQLEIKLSYATFFRKSKINKNKYTAKFFKSADKHEIERTDLGYKAFKNVRGTAPYFQNVKLKVITMVAQLGSPNLFLTLSAAEAHWTELLRMLLQKERSEIVPDEAIQQMTKANINKLLKRNVVDVTLHFSNRVKLLFKHMQKCELFDKYRVSDYFFRIEFQQRGSPHLHALLWLKDSNGQSPPRFEKSDNDSRQECVKFIDSVISAKLPEKDSELKHDVSFFQTHGHTFTCRKKCKKITIQAHEGHGKFDGAREGPKLILNSCRFKFPQFPMPQTTIIDAPDSDTTAENFRIWREQYKKVRKFILRQTYSDDSGSLTERLSKLTFEQFLEAVGLTQSEYINALKMSVCEHRSCSEVFLKRDCADLFVNNYNENILKIHRANMDLSFVVNEYRCVAYILGYLTKNESGLSRLLHQIDIECAKYGRSPHEKLKLFSRALDNSREVCRSEVVYRMLGLHFCSSSRTHAFVQTAHPNKRDGLMRGNIEDLDDDDDPFHKSIIDYYEHRPDDLEHLSLAEFVRDYKIVYKSKAEKEADAHIDPNPDEDYTDRDDSVVRCLKNNKGRFRRNNKATMVRYHLSKHNDTEIKRALLVLFFPFRDEIAQIHEVNGKTVDDVYQEHADKVESVRRQFEPDRNLLLNVEQAMDNIQAAGFDDDNADDMLSDELSEPEMNEETTTTDELQHFISTAHGPSPNDETTLMKRQVICDMIRKLNPQQRRIFDDVIERLASGKNDPNEAVPFHLYIGGKAGTGKTFLIKTIIEAAKLLLMKSGDDLSKPTVLVMSPTASAARLIGGETIESALKFSRNDDSECFEVFSSTARCANEYEQLKVVFIDEISMVGSNKLHQIHTRLEELLGQNEQPFSGLSLVVTGDFFQLPPVKDKWIFANNWRPNRADFTAPNKWKQFFKIYELTEKMRSLEDVEFSNLCDRIGSNSLNESDEKILSERVIDCPNENCHDAYREGTLAVIVADNCKRSEINSAMLETLPGVCAEFVAKDVATNVKDFPHHTLLDLPYTRTGGLPFKLQLKVTCPVMLTVNVDKSDGLTNGTRGYVTGIDKDNLTVWVKFTEGVGFKSASVRRKQHNPIGDSASVPITMCKTSFKLNPPNNSVRIQRSQFPLILAYAITAHKAQGLTLNEVILDFSSTGRKSVPAGCFYVAATRVKRLSDLYLKSFRRSMITCSSVVHSEFSRLRQNSSYVFYKQPLTFSNDAVQLAYLNINGLKHGSHIVDLDNDMNLKAVDVICVAETKLSPLDSEEIIIAGFTSFVRLDFAENSMGMMLYMRRGSNIQPHIHASFNSTSPRTQLVQLDIDKHSFCFVYVHPSDVCAGLQLLERTVRPKDIVIGDLNVDYLTSNGRQQLLRFCESNSLTVSDHGPTHAQSCIDHVLLPDVYSSSNQFVQTVINFYSDHRAVCVKLFS